MSGLVGQVFVGPVDMDGYNLEAGWMSAADSSGCRGAAISLTATVAAAQQLSELVANADRQVTIGEHTGVLEYVWLEPHVVDAFSGWYLLKGFDYSPYRVGDRARFCDIRLQGVLVGDRQVVVPTSSRPRTNTHSLPGAELLVAPVTDAGGSAGFAVEPGGTQVTREFDADHAAAWGAAADARVMDMRVATVGTLPELALAGTGFGGSPPDWVVARGGDCRAYDVSQARAVYGPHPFAESSDLVLENGLVRAWCGARGIVPYFTVMAFAAGAWRQEGCVVLADETGGPVLESARLKAVTPEAVTAALRVAGIGEVFVTLKRGERMLRIQHGSTRAPAVSAVRRIGWLGTPPTVAGLGDALSAAGKFGAGIQLGDIGAFVPTPFNEIVIMTLAYVQPLEPDGAVGFTHDGRRFFATIANAVLFLYGEGSDFPGTWGESLKAATLPSGAVDGIGGLPAEGEGVAYGVVGGDPFVLIGDQNNNRAWGYAPSAGIVDTATALNASPIYQGTYSGGADGVHTLVGYDWDGDGDDEFVFCDEGSGAVVYADYGGSGDVTDPDNWEHWTIATLDHPRTIPPQCPGDILGNGRGDLVIACRSSSAGPKVFILEAPADPSEFGDLTHPTWNATGLGGHTYVKGAMWPVLFRSETGGPRLDIATFDGTTGEPHFWRASEDYADVHYLPNPPILTGDEAWVIGAVPDPSGPATKPDILMYTEGDNAPGSSARGYLFRSSDGGATYQIAPIAGMPAGSPAKTFVYGHPLESRLIPMDWSGLADRGEMVMADSGGTNGGNQLAGFSFYDRANVLSKTPPDVVGLAQNNGTGTSLTVTLRNLADTANKTPDAGNLLVAVVTLAAATQKVTPPAGWEQVFPYSYADPGYAYFAKWVGSHAITDAAASLWGLAPGGSSWMVSVYEVLDAHATHPFMNHSVRRRPSGNNATVKLPSLKFDEAGVLVITCYGYTTTEASFTPPTGFTVGTKIFPGGTRRHSTAYKRYTAAEQFDDPLDPDRQLVIGETGALDITVPTNTQGIGIGLAIRGAS